MVAGSLSQAAYWLGRALTIAIPCSACGREYDVTLFQYGRTIWCTCGNRVAGERIERRLSRGVEARFLADAMLGKLARWLRILGFDCAHEPDIPDVVLVRTAIAESRTVLTRDRALTEDWRISGIYLVRSEKTFDQLGEILRHFDLSDAIRLFRRCSRCNSVLDVVPVHEVADRVPADVAAMQRELRHCGTCRRVYWEGSHTRRMQHVVERLVAPA